MIFFNPTAALPPPRCPRECCLAWTGLPDSPTPPDRKQLEKKKTPPALSKVRFESFNEGLSAQIMHIGSYAAEAPTIEKLHRFIKEKGYEAVGKHHEIYLGDPRKTAPERLRTVIRQPMKPSGYVT